jgi:hypothetical protein
MAKFQRIHPIVKTDSAESILQLPRSGTTLLYNGLAKCLSLPTRQLFVLPFETGSHFVAQAGLKLSIFLTQPPEFQACNYACTVFFLKGESLLSVASMWVPSPCLFSMFLKVESWEHLHLTYLLNWGSFIKNLNS